MITNRILSPLICWINVHSVHLSLRLLIVEGIKISGIHTPSGVVLIPQPSASIDKGEVKHVQVRSSNVRLSIMHSSSEAMRVEDVRIAR